MTREQLKEEKKELIEQLGVQLETENLAPVAARIFATLILNGKQGITFDQLVNGLQASKSTVSAHLEHLQNTNKVTYFTKPGDRKRYFIISPDLMLNVIDEMVRKWESQKRIHEKVLEYKQKHNEYVKDEEDEIQFDLEFQINFLTFLDEATTAVQKLKLKLAQE